MPSVFTKIIEGEIPATFVWRDERCVAFMSINPLRTGHTLVVPVEEVDHWLDASSDLLAHLIGVARQVGQAIESVYQPERVGLVIAGLEVPHLHLHVVPMDRASDLDFANAAASVERDRLEAEAAKLREALDGSGSSR